MSDTPIIDKIKARYGDKVLETHNFRGDQTVTVDKSINTDLLQWLRDDPEMDMCFLMDLTCVDYMDRKQARFEVVYHLFSLQHNHRVRIKCPPPGTLNSYRFEGESSKENLRYVKEFTPGTADRPGQ